MDFEDRDRGSISTARSLYVHIPFCRRICPYCDFAVTTPARAPFSYTEFTDLLRREIAGHRERLRIRTLYLGGGTPSALDSRCLTDLVTAIEGRHDLSRVVEATIEANPEDVDPEKARLFRDLGFTRVSLGVQAFDSRSLAMLGRRHRHEDVVRAVEFLRAADLHDISFDLIVAHPTQDLVRLEKDLAAALSLRPTHVSCYAMTYEEGTPYERARRRGSLAATPEDLESDLLRLARSSLVRAGFENYEVSNFALPGCRSIHNLAYWKRSPYLGIGPSAASYDGDRRWQNPRNLRRWADDLVAGRPPEPELLDLNARLLEAFMLGLRRPVGLRWRRLNREFSKVLPADLMQRIDTLASDGLLTNSPTSLRPTPRGLELADAITLELLGGHDPSRR